MNNIYIYTYIYERRNLQSRSSNNDNSVYRRLDSIWLTYIYIRTYMSEEIYKIDHQIKW